MRKIDIKKLEVPLFAIVVILLIIQCVFAFFKLESWAISLQLFADFVIGFVLGYWGLRRFVLHD